MKSEVFVDLLSVIALLFKKFNKPDDEYLLFPLFYAGPVKKLQQSINNTLKIRNARNESKVKYRQTMSFSLYVRFSQHLLAYRLSIFARVQGWNQLLHYLTPNSSVLVL